MIDITNYHSVLDSGFDDQLLIYTQQMAEHLCLLVGKQTDAKLVRASLGDVLPSRHIKVKIRFVEKKQASFIGSFTNNMILLPMYGAKIRLNRFEATPNGKQLNALPPMEFSSGELVKLESNTRYFSMDILETGILLEASDKEVRPIMKLFDANTLAVLNIMPTDNKLTYVYHAFNLLAGMASEPGRALLHDLALSGDEMIRWHAAQAYCKAATADKAVQLLELIAQNDPAQHIRQLAHSTLHQNGADTCTI